MESGNQNNYFVSLPNEWLPEMLYEAGLLVLNTSLELLDEGWGFSSCSPFQISFSGAKPVFFDLSSLERRHPMDGSWRPFREFLKSFVYPLLKNRLGKCSISEYFLLNREGIEPQVFYDQIGWFHRLTQPCLPLVTVPAWLEIGFRNKLDRGHMASGTRYSLSPPRAKRSVRILLNFLRQSLEKAVPDFKALGKRLQKSEKGDGIERKTGKIEEVIIKKKPKQVLLLKPENIFPDFLGRFPETGFVLAYQEEHNARVFWNCIKRSSVKASVMILDADRSSLHQRCSGFFDLVIRFDSI